MTNKNRTKSILNNQEYKLANKLMTIPRFCGLLQSDGHFTVTYDKKKVQNPKIILTQRNKHICWLYGIQDWLESLEIKSVLSKHKRFVTKYHERSINLVIDRINCRNLLSLIEKTEKINEIPLLFDNKRVSYLLLKESIKIKQSSNQKSLLENEAAMLVDIKHSGLKRKVGPKGLSREQLTDRLGFSKLQTKNCANSLIEKIQEKVKISGNKILKIVLKNTEQINPVLAEFISGVFDGDGSFSIGLFVHLSKDGKKLNKRRAFEIVPSINITSETEKEAYLFKIINAVFVKKESLNIVNVNTKGNGSRLVIKNVAILKKNVVPFFTKYEPCIEKNRVRFKTFCKIIQELPFDYKNKQKVVEIITEIYKTDLYKRKRSLEDFLNIVELEYN